MPLSSTLERPETKRPDTVAPLQAPLITQRTRAREGKKRPEPATSRGFGEGRPDREGKRRGGRKRSAGLSKADWGPLGKHPGLEAIVARQRLHLPLAGRLTAQQVNQAWKRAAASHHPDRGGSHDTMQLVNGARDLLLGRDLD
ncbi:MAG: molecular chaperone DnaJ [Cyanobacteriota bacterium]|nr:molecular chaperone DnaJ [Cyanobacteriota bacterium]